VEVDWLTTIQTGRVDVSELINYQLIRAQLGELYGSDPYNIRRTCGSSVAGSYRCPSTLETASELEQCVGRRRSV